MTVLDRLFGRRRDLHAAAALYTAIVAQARAPALYRDLGVPDTLDGRFDMVALHLILILHRLKGQGAAAEDRARRLHEVMAEDFDRSLREMGTGDGGIGRRVTAMVRGVTGRLLAYDAALKEAGDHALEVVLDNNVYGTVPEVAPARLAAMAGYVRRQVAALAALPLDELLAGRVRFSPWEEGPGEGGPGEPAPEKTE